MDSVLDKIDWSIVRDSSMCYLGNDDYDRTFEFLDVLTDSILVTFIVNHCKSDDGFDCFISFEYRDSEILTSKTEHVSSGDLASWFLGKTSALTVLFGKIFRIYNYLEGEDD